MTSSQALSAALAVIERDQLAAYTRILDALDGIVIGFDVGGETFSVSAADRLRVSTNADYVAKVEVRTDRSAILALIDGEIELLEAVKTRRLKIVADVSLMTRLARAERAFAEGAARARRIRPILEAYRVG